MKQRAKENYAKNKEKKLKANAAWRKANAERMKVLRKRWNDKPESREIMKDFRKLPWYRAKRNAEERIREKVKRLNIGCDIKTFKAHIEAQFRDGMTWDNYGDHWELDHVKAIADHRLCEIAIASHYTNLQPLTIEENRLKAQADKDRRLRRDLVTP